MSKQALSTIVAGLLTEEQAARILGCSVHKLRADRFYRRGVRYVKNGRSVRYRVEDLNEYIENRIVSHEMAVA